MNDTKQSGKPSAWKEASAFLAMAGGFFYALAITYGVGYSSSFYDVLGIQIFRHTEPTEFLMLWSDEPGATASILILSWSLLFVAIVYLLWNAIPRIILAVVNLVIQISRKIALFLRGVKRVAMAFLRRIARAVSPFFKVMRLMALLLHIAMRMIVCMAVGAPYLIFYPAVLFQYTIFSFLHICFKGAHRFLCEAYNTLLEDLGRKPKQVRVDYAWMEEMVRSSKLVPEEYKKFGAERLAKYHADTREKIKKLCNVFAKLEKHPPDKQPPTEQSADKQISAEQPLAKQPSAKQSPNEQSTNGKPNNAPIEKSKLLFCLAFIIPTFIIVHQIGSCFGEEAGNYAKGALGYKVPPKFMCNNKENQANDKPETRGAKQATERNSNNQSRPKSPLPAISCSFPERKQSNEFPHVYVTLRSEKFPLTDMRLVGATLNTIILHNAEQQFMIIPRSNLKFLEIGKPKNGKSGNGKVINKTIQQINEKLAGINARIKQHNEDHKKIAEQAREVIVRFESESAGGGKTIEQLRGAIKNVEEKINAHIADRSRLNDLEQRINAKITTRYEEIEGHNQKLQARLDDFKKNIEKQDEKNKIDEVHDPKLQARLDDFENDIKEQNEKIKEHARKSQDRLSGFEKYIKERMDIQDEDIEKHDEKSKAQLAQFGRRIEKLVDFYQIEPESDAETQPQLQPATNENNPADVNENTQGAPGSSPEPAETTGPDVSS